MTKLCFYHNTRVWPNGPERGQKGKPWQKKGRRQRHRPAGAKKSHHWKAHRRRKGQAAGKKKTPTGSRRQGAKGEHRRRVASGRRARVKRSGHSWATVVKDYTLTHARTSLTSDTLFQRNPPCVRIHCTKKRGRWSRRRKRWGRAAAGRAGGRVILGGDGVMSPRYS